MITFKSTPRDSLLEVKCREALLECAMCSAYELATMTAPGVELSVKSCFREVIIPGDEATGDRIFLLPIEFTDDFKNIVYQIQGEELCQ